MYAKLVAYTEVAVRDKYGCIKVPRDHESGLWVKDLKHKKRKFESADDEQTRSKRLYLDKDKINLLNQIPIRWRTQFSFEERLEQLRGYYTIAKDLKVSRKLDSGLGEWLHHQRNKYLKDDRKFMREEYPQMVAIGYQF